MNNKDKYKDIWLVLIFFLILIPGIYLCDKYLFDGEILLEGVSDEIVIDDAKKDNVSIKTKYKSEELIFTSTDENIATVDKEGNVKSVSDGEAKIIVKKKNSDVSQTVTVVVSEGKKSTSTTEETQNAINTTKEENTKIETITQSAITNANKSSWSIVKEKISGTDNLV